jgi:intergrase/recombinase
VFLPKPVKPPNDSLFYVAQLLHYGLPPMKTKDPAKTRLLMAFGTQRELIVPKHILELEKSLKKQYSQANELQVKMRKGQRESKRRPLDERNRNATRLWLCKNL